MEETAEVLKAEDAQSNTLELLFHFRQLYRWPKRTGYWFNVSHNNGRIQVFRRRGERFADNCLIERDRFGGGSVMIWSGIMGRTKTNLIVVQGNLNAHGYINQILQPDAVPFIQRHGPAILMHGNARPHVARICRQLLNRNTVNVLPWPAVSPDMNPIEHIWDYLGRKVRARGNVHNLRDMENALIQEWNNTPNVVIRRYVRSMRGRLAACIKSRGGHTHSTLTTVNIEFPI